MEPWKLEPAHDHGLTLRESFRSLRRENGLIATGMHLAWWGMVRGYLGLWHRLTIHGRAKLPHAPPFILIANHASHLDTLVLAAAVPWRLRARLYPIAAGDVFFETPARSALSALFLNALPMWRRRCGSHALQELRQRLQQEQCCYVLFPEGTRSRDGTMGGFKRGLGMLVAQTAVPVVPCYLDGCYAALGPGRRLPHPAKIHLHIGTPRTFHDVANEREGWEQIATVLHKAVCELR